MLQGRADALAVLFSLIFLTLGSLWISEVGLQTDEALFGQGIFPPFGHSVEILGKQRPIMVMTYVGALKSYVWKPVLKNLKPSAATIRLPAVVLGALTIWLFYLLAKRTVGTRAALVGTALLSVDASYMMTTRWDWGPVVLQHLMLLGGVLAILRFVDDRRLRWLALGFFLFGLGLWDKAIFAWSLVGLGVATVTAFPRRLWALLTLRHTAIATVALLFGASPLVYFNLSNEFVTFRQNSTWDWNQDISAKVRAAQVTLEGRSLFGSIPRDASELPFREPDDMWKRFWVHATDWTGAQTINLYVLLFLLSVFMLPLAWKTSARTALLFAAVFTLVTWFQMAFQRNGAGSAHHIILLWPIPYLAVGALLTQGFRRFGRAGTPLLALVVGLACTSSVLVIGTYYRNMLRNGGTTAWSDAVYPAAEALLQTRPRFVCFLDWGFHDSIRLLQRGQIESCEAVDPESDLETAKRQISNREIVFMAHTPGNEIQPERTDRFMKFAVAEGYRKTEERIFYDYNGRPMIEVFKLFRP